MSLKKTISCSVLMLFLAQTPSSAEIYEKGLLDDVINLGTNLLNSQNEIEKILKPIYTFDETASVDDMAKVAAKFKVKLDQIYSSGLSVDQAFDLSIEKIAKRGTILDREMFQSFIKKVKKQESKQRKKISSSARKKKKSPEKEETQAPKEVLFGMVQVFCGCLLENVPLPFASNIGSGLVESGSSFIQTFYEIEPAS